MGRATLQTERSLKESHRLVDSSERRAVVFENGLTAIIHRHDAAPVVAVRVYVRGGSIFEGPWTGSGICHLLEHVVTCGGTQRRSEEELVALGDEIGGLVNAYTSVDHICHHVCTPREHYATAVEMFADYVMRPLLSRAVFDREMGVVRRELERDRTDPETQLEELLHEVLYQDHPMRHPVIGRPSLLAALTHEDILAYAEAIHAPDNVVVVIAGDVDLSEATKTVAHRFAGFAERRRSQLILPDPTLPVAPVRVEKGVEVESVSTTFAWMTVRSPHVDDAPLDLLSSVLCDGEAARLVKKLRWDTGLAYDVSGIHDSTWHTPGMFHVSVQCVADGVDKIENALLEAIERLQCEPITEAELDRARRQNITSIEFQQETAEGPATQIGEDFLATGNLDYASAYLDRLRTAKPEDLHSVARRYLRPDAFARVSIVPRRTDQRPIANAKHDKRPTLHESVAPNGLPCVVRTMPRSRFVAVHLSFLGGLLSETERTNGLFNLMAHCRVRGAAGYDGDQIADCFAARGSSLRSGSGLNQFGCSFVARAEDFEPLLEMMANVVSKPTFDADEIAKIRPVICDQIARIDEDWHSELIRLARRRFFSHSPYRMPRLGVFENINRFTPGDLQALQASFVTSANGVLAIAGAVEADQATECAARFLEGIETESVDVAPSVEPEPPHTCDRLFVKRSEEDREVAGLFVGFPGLDVADRENRAPLMLIETMLAGYTLAGGRLYSKLRGGASDLAYEVSAAGLIGLLPGYVAFTVGCEPRRVSEVYRVVRTEIEELRAGRFQDDELQRAKGMVVTGELDQLQSPAEFAMRMGIDAVFGLGASDWQAFLDEVREVDRDAVVQAAETYLKYATVAVATPMPECVDLPIERQDEAPED